ncbi:MAG: alginate lyase family protein [Prevotellaceae bacterium]|jgi:hypothetical protein|nr:alginate lyase family protein [Prevotellaceae bacterium]
MITNTSIRKKRFYLAFLLLFLGLHLQANLPHPTLLLTKKGVKEIKSSQKKAPLFRQTVENAKQEIDIVLTKPMEVPLPKDAGGGYTHEVHKKNYMDMLNAGLVYQITGDKKYAGYAKEMLLRYAEMYPKLGLHPVQKSNYRGKLFWQGLNECVWLVHVSQAYDCVYDYLTEAERKHIEKNLFYPMCDFIARENISAFNKIHNHGTWAVAAVGMIGYVMGDKDLTGKALYGYNKDRKGGFLSQIEQLFSPDGYFTEGPYYQRYALQPFVMFAQVVENNQPELKIFEYNDGMILKAVDVEFQLMEPDGQIFYLNDALDKTWHTAELVYALNVAYNMQPHKKDLLDIARKQNRVILSEAGLRVAKDLHKGETKPYIRKTMLLRDGAKGEDGAIAVLRAGNKDETAAVMKYTSHGLSHGHYDKLSITFYDNYHEIIKDYGAARFLNIEPKNGGHYLPENNTFAMQTVAHNTLVVDETSHFKGNIRISEKYSPEHLFFKNTDRIKVAGAEDTNAYPGTVMNRKIALISDERLEYPVLADVFTVKSEEKHQFDLPFYFMGQLISTNFEYEAHTSQRHTFGTRYGYQHLWVEAMGKTEKPAACLTFLNGNRFYSITSLVNPDTELFINRIGANDPEFNLKNNPCFILRDKNLSERTYVNIVEPHGEFNPVLEYTNAPCSNIQSVKLIENSQSKAIVEITLKSGETVKAEIGK